MRSLQLARLNLPLNEPTPFTLFIKALSLLPVSSSGLSRHSVELEGRDACLCSRLGVWLTRLRFNFLSLYKCETWKMFGAWWKSSLLKIGFTAVQITNLWHYQVSRIHLPCERTDELIKRTSFEIDYTKGSRQSTVRLFVREKEKEREWGRKREYLQMSAMTLQKVPEP